MFKPSPHQSFGVTFVACTHEALLENTQMMTLFYVHGMLHLAIAKKGERSSRDFLPSCFPVHLGVQVFLVYSMHMSATRSCSGLGI